MKPSSQDAEPEILVHLAAMRREIENLRRRDLAREAALARLSDEVARAARLQRQWMPGQLPAVQGARLTACSRAAEKVSGDFYDAVRLNDNCVALVVADAAGHGLAAGLLSALLLGSLHRARTRDDAELLNPAALLNRLHEDLAGRGLADCEFVTAVHSIYDETSRLMTFARAGAPHPVLVRPGKRSKPLVCEGLPLGVEASRPYATSTVQLQPGDTVFFYTDGLEPLFDGTSPASSGASLNRWLENAAASDVQARFQELEANFTQSGIPHSRLDDVALLALQITAANP